MRYDDDTDSQSQITAWLEAELGGEVVAIHRQARWRPAWFADVQRGAERLELCVRGERLDSPSAFDLRHEMRFQSMLSDRGIPVAAVHGWSDQPTAYVMDRVPGVDNFAGVEDTERTSVMEHYVELLAELHALDPAPFGAAGIARAERPEDAGRVGLRHFEQRAYRDLKHVPDPFLEFALAYLARNPIDTGGREGPVVWDAGQLHHQDGKVVALLDLEFGHIGDPMMDLGALWVRNPFIPFGDIAALMRHYEKVSGTPVDLAAVRHHCILWNLSNELAFHTALVDPTPGTDYLLNRYWCTESNLFALEVMADDLGVQADPVAMPEPRVSPVGSAQDHLVRSLEDLTPERGFARYRMRTAVRLSHHLRRVDEIGEQLVAADLDELRPLLGHRPATWAEGEAELERFVLADAGAHDAELVALFIRRFHRTLLLLGPAHSPPTRHRVAPLPTL